MLPNELHLFHEFIDGKFNFDLYYIQSSYRGRTRGADTDAVGNIPDVCSLCFYVFWREVHRKPTRHIIRARRRVPAQTKVIERGLNEFFCCVRCVLLIFLYAWEAKNIIFNWSFKVATKYVCSPHVSKWIHMVESRLALKQKRMRIYKECVYIL